MRAELTGDSLPSAGAEALVPLVAPALIALLYAIGFRRRWRASAIDRQSALRRGALFLVGAGAVAVAGSEPVERLADAQFAAHMVQHTLLMLVAPTLIVAAHPIGTLMWGLPRVVRAAVARAVAPILTWSKPRRPATLVAALLAYEAVITVWHVPTLYEAALRHPVVHGGEHATLLLSGLLFWGAVFAIPAAARASAVIVVFAAALYSGAIGALLTLSTQPWYPTYAAQAPSAADALRDQQLAGLIMWIVGGFIHGVAALVLAREWLRVQAPPVFVT